MWAYFNFYRLDEILIVLSRAFHIFTQLYPKLLFIYTDLDFGADKFIL